MQRGDNEKIFFKACDLPINTTGKLTRKLPCNMKKGVVAEI